MKIWKNTLLFLKQLNKNVKMVEQLQANWFIDSFRLMLTSLSELVDNSFGIFNSIECE